MCVTPNTTGVLILLKLTFRSSDILVIYYTVYKVNKLYFSVCHEYIFILSIFNEVGGKKTINLKVVCIPETTSSTRPRTRLLTKIWPLGTECSRATLRKGRSRMSFQEKETLYDISVDIFSRCLPGHTGFSDERHFLFPTRCPLCNCVERFHGRICTHGNRNHHVIRCRYPAVEASAVVQINHDDNYCVRPFYPDGIITSSTP